MLTRQMEIEHAQRHLSEPCPFCHLKTVHLWYDPKNQDRPYQVRCSLCEARGPACDCGEESAVPAWMSIVQQIKRER